MKPVINIDELEYISHDDGKIRGSYAEVSSKIGAKKLGYNLTIAPPGASVCPFHNHHNEEEMFFILEGEGKLRFGDKEYPLRKGDFVACPPGGREVAHQILNTGTTDLKYISLSNKESVEICEYPDSNKTGVFVGRDGKRILRQIYKADSVVDYFLGET